MDELNFNFLVGLPPEELIRYFEEKYQVTSWSWRDLYGAANLSAFTVAKVMKEDILQDIYTALDNAIRDGITADKFIARLGPELKSKGWWGRMFAKDVPGYDGMADPLDLVQLGSAHRLKTIYYTNLTTGYARGRHAMQKDNIANRPFWQYKAVLDKNTRKKHASLDGVVIAADDPVWEVLYPPNGWGCRCYVRSLSRLQLEAEGLEVTQGELIDTSWIAPEWRFNPGKDIKLK